MKRQRHEASDPSEPTSDLREVTKESDMTIVSPLEPDDLEEALYGTFPASDPVAWESRFTAGRPTKSK